MESIIREEVGLYWLYRKFDEYAGLIPFPEEACKVLRRLIDIKEVHSFTFTPATSARRLVEHWLDTGRLPMQHRGKAIDEQLSGVPAGGELSDYVELNDSLDGQTIIHCSDLIRLMLAERMTVPRFLLADGFEEIDGFGELLKQDAAKCAAYKRAWELWEEHDTWANMKHQNDPDKFEKIQANLARIKAELTSLSLPPDVTDKQPQATEVKSLSKRQVMEAFGGVVKKAESLETALENLPNWIAPARIARGTRGRNGHQSKWDPVLLAIALHENQKATLLRLDNAFSRYASMSPWREEWRERSEDLRI